MTFKIEDKDWSRMLDLVASGNDGGTASQLIKDKRKAIARFICGVKLEQSCLNYNSQWKEYYGYFSDFGNKALKLGATPEEIQMAFDLVEVPEKYLQQLKSLAGKKLNNRFVGSIVKKILDENYDINFLPHNGNAITMEGRDAMRRNGRKWTIGYKTEITKGDKKVALVFDAITDEGDGPCSYLIDNSSDKIFDSMNFWQPIGKLEFTKKILETLKTV
jgi:hypothetical protein